MLLLVTASALVLKQWTCLHHRPSTFSRADLDDPAVSFSALTPLVGWVIGPVNTVAEISCNVSSGRISELTQIMDLVYCRRVRLADATRKVAVARAARKRVASGDVIAAIIGICESEASAGDSRRSACFERYLKNFARHITTSGNRFVGR